jgi:hypothetical protein
MAEHKTNTLDERFDEVQHAFLEQRDFTTLCFDRARQEFAAGLAGVRHDLAGVKADVAGMKADLVGVKADVAGVKQDVAGVNHRLDRHELVLSEILNEVKALRG